MQSLIILLLLSLVNSLDSWKFMNRIFSLAAIKKDNDQDEQRTSFTLAKVVGNNFESFQKNNPICFSSPSSQQFMLKFNQAPKNIFIIAKPEDDIYSSMRQAIHFICEKGLTVFLDPLSYAYIIDEHKSEFQAYFNNTNVNEPPCFNLHQQSTSSFSTSKQAEIVRCSDKIKIIDDKSLGYVDIIVSLGGDGLLMHCNTLFEASRQSIPPIMSFDFGSMGFLAPFSFDEFEFEVQLTPKSSIISPQQILLIFHYLTD